MSINKDCFTKLERKELRRLSSLAYEHALAKALESLEEKFGQWKKNKITSFELSDSIHKFHNGIARDLWSFYRNGDDEMIVVHAVAKGILSREEIKGALWPKIEQKVNMLRDKF
ncbi:MAG: hypothetical protein R6U54_03480 [Candidatus Omnitrophota bacterium]